MGDRRVGIGMVVMRDEQDSGAGRPLDGALGRATVRVADDVVARTEVSGLPEERSKPGDEAGAEIVDRMASARTESAGKKAATTGSRSSGSARTSA